MKRNAILYFLPIFVSNSSAFCCGPEHASRTNGHQLSKATSCRPAPSQQRCAVHRLHVCDLAHRNPATRRLRSAASASRTTPLVFKRNRLHIEASLRTNDSRAEPPRPQSGPGRFTPAPADQGSSTSHFAPSETFQKLTLGVLLAPAVPASDRCTNRLSTSLRRLPCALSRGRCPRISPFIARWTLPRQETHR
jgi:hypothetical protein